MSATRRLAAIMAADVAGYSRLMGADEEGTLRRLQAHRRELIDPKIAEHRGRIVKTTGDGLLVEFASVVDAVRCAVEVQRGMIDRDAGLSDDQRIRFRVGINLGDIIADGDDIFGDGVNVAARLETLAEPGGVCISGAVHEQIGDRLGYDFADKGERRVKNILRPIRIHLLDATAVGATPLVPLRVVGPQHRPARRGRMPRPSSRKAAPRLSIVVLPFANLSSDPEQEYFVDAITDDVTTDLSRIADSFVISRTTAFIYKGRAVDVKEIGLDLGVRYVLEGSVRRLGEQVQVNVQLIDAETGAHVWADRFDTDRTNLATAQRDITGRLARTLQLELVVAAGRQIEQEQSVNLDARDLVMRGWAGWHKPRTEAQQQEDLHFFEQALELDPRSAAARVGVATVLIDNVIHGWTKSREQDLARAELLLHEALERDRSSWRLHWALGVLRRNQARFVEAKMEFEETIALDRNSAVAMLHLGWTLIALVRPEEALPHFEKAIRLTPRYPNIHFYYYGLGACHQYLGHLDEAIAILQKAWTTNAPFYQIPWHLAAALGLTGDLEAAGAALAAAQKLNPGLRSLTDHRRMISWYGNPAFAALAAKTIDAGLLLAGLPEE
jgi:adenylate cyclase